jgi:photosystem II stability/assembly factor-like uncharacterized protein
MKRIILAAAACFLLAALAACNLTSEGVTPSIPWNSFNTQSPGETLPSGGKLEPSPTSTQLPPTASPTPTANPLIPSRLDAGTAIDILRLEMFDAQNGWGIGGPRATGSAGRVFRTGDGGNSWVEVTPPEAAESAAALGSMAAIGYFADPQTAWVTYHASIPSGVPENPVVWRTFDGGRSWQPSSPLPTAGLTETYWASHILFLESGNNQWDGWLLVHVGAGMNHDYVALYHTADNGATWMRIIDPMIDGGIQSCTKTGLAFTDVQNGWLTGNCNGVRAGAFLFKTADGGATWIPVALPVPEDHPDLFTAEQYACAVRAPFLLNDQVFLGVECSDMGDPSAAPLAYMYHGAAAAALLPYTYPGGDIFTLDGHRIWALGLEIYRTDDAGLTWSRVSEVTWEAQFDFVTSTLGWAAVHKDSEYGLVRTDDGGAFWTQLAPVVAAGP